MLETNKKFKLKLKKIKIVGDKNTFMLFSLLGSSLPLVRSSGCEKEKIFNFFLFHFDESLTICKNTWCLVKCRKTEWSNSWRHWVITESFLKHAKTLLYYTYITLIINNTKSINVVIYNNVYRDRYRAEKFWKYVVIAGKQ